MVNAETERRKPSEGAYIGNLDAHARNLHHGRFNPYLTILQKPINLAGEPQARTDNTNPSSESS